jgi:hypothetical protein
MSSPETAACRHCDGTFELPARAGRKPQYCSSEHQRAARSVAEAARRQRKREAEAAAAAAALAALTPADRALLEAEAEQQRQRKAKEKERKKAEKKRRKAAPLADAVAGVIDWVAPVTDEFYKGTGYVAVDPTREYSWQRDSKSKWATTVQRHDSLRSQASLDTRRAYGLELEYLPTRADLEFVAWRRSLITALWGEAS